MITSVKNAKWIIALTIAVTLLTATPGKAQGRESIETQYTRPNALFRASQVAVYGSAAADLATTWRGLGPYRREVNPILGQSRVRQGSIVLGTSVALNLLTGKLYKSGHPKVATVLNFIIAGGHSYAAVKNGWK